MLDEFSKIVLVSLSSLHQRSFPLGWLAFAWVHLKYVYVSLNFLTLSVQFSMRSPKILRLTVLAMAKRCSRLFKIQFLTVYCVAFIQMLTPMQGVFNLYFPSIESNGGFFLMQIYCSNRLVHKLTNKKV